MKKRWAFLFGAMLVLLLSGCAREPITHHDPAHVVAQIRDHYEQGLETLPLSLQRHYAQRLYRMTGDDAFLPWNYRYAEQLLQSLQRDLDALALDPDYVYTRDQQLLSRRPQHTLRQRQRTQLLADYPGMNFTRSLLFRMTQLEYYGLLDLLTPEQQQQAQALFERMDIAAFVLAEATLRQYAAQAANMVWFLHQLQGQDLRTEFVQAFRDHYPPEHDYLLSRAELHNMIYGMTHMVIADSRYYQRHVDAEEFAWIIDYLTARLPFLLAETTADIQAEMGIVLMLAGGEEAQAVEYIRQALLAAYDDEARMIPSPTGSRDFARGEHRNVLAVLLLDWPAALIPGPLLDPDRF